MKPTRIRSFTVINHKAQYELGLSLGEYCLADLVHHLASNPQNKFPGWCWASRKNLAEMLGVSERKVYRGLKKLSESSLVEMNRDALIRATPRWYEATKTDKVADTKQPALTKVQSDPDKVAVDPPDKVADYNKREDSKSNNKIHTGAAAPSYAPIVKAYQSGINGRARLTDGARKKIQSRLKSYQEPDLVKAIVNFSKDRWQMKHNAHRGIAWFFHTDDRVEQYINLKERKRIEL